MVNKRADAVQMIPVDRIHVLNPRERDKGKFREVVDSIAKIGLKKPITVSRRKNTRGGEPGYDLVCGQGRLEAFQLLDQERIPAIVVDLEAEDCFLFSLVENLARRQYSSLELIHNISTLSERGHSPSRIAAKTGLSRDYVTGVLQLMKKGEERLIVAVERNQIPLSVAIEISAIGDGDVQAALTQAYERNELRGRKLQTAMRVVQQRIRRGRKFESSGGSDKKKKVSSHAMVRAYRQETERQRALIKKADLTQSRLFVVVNALKQLLADKHFTTLLRAEGLDTMPRQLAEMLHRKEAAE